MDASVIVHSDLYRLNLNKAKLKAVTRTSTLFSGFAMVALVEMTIEINNDLNSDIPALVLHGFTIVTCTLIGVHLLALMISTCLLPQIETISQHYELVSASSSSILEASTSERQQQQNRRGAVVLDMYHDQFRPQLARASTAELRSPTALPSSILSADDSTPSVHIVGDKKKSLKYDHLFNHSLPLEKFQIYIELSWLLSNGVGIFLFLMQVAFVCFVKFSPMKNSANVFISGWIIVSIILIVFLLFSYRFYHLMVEYKLFNRHSDLKMMDLDIQKLANLSVEKKKFNFLNKNRLAGIFQFNETKNKVSPVVDETTLEERRVDEDDNDKKFESISLFPSSKQKRNAFSGNRTKSVS